MGALYDYVHPVADMFPSLGDDELRALADSIRNTGQRRPILIGIMPDGRNALIDGRNRIAACALIGETVRHERREYRSDEDAIADIVAHNLTRRHLTPSQAAWLALQILPRLEAAAAERMRAGQPVEDPGANMRQGRSAGQAADLVGISRRLVNTAQAVERDGVRELGALVASGQLAVSAAADVARLPEDEQRELCAEGPAAVRRRAAEIRKASQPAPGPRLAPPLPEPTTEKSQSEPDEEQENRRRRAAGFLEATGNVEDARALLALPRAEQVNLLQSGADAIRARVEAMRLAEIPRDKPRSLTSGMTSSDDENWTTPADLLAVIRRVDVIGLDPCSNSKSVVRARKAFTVEDDGLAQEWGGHRLVFVNPPYGKEIPAWVAKIVAEANEGVEIIALVPARTDTRWFHELVAPAAAVTFVSGRLKFGGAKTSAPFPSALVYFGRRVARFRSAMVKTGWTVAEIDA